MIVTKRLGRLVACAAVLCGTSFVPAMAAEGPLVQTGHGALQGATVDGADKFLGIPFAAPPVGALRWQAPAAPASWTETRDATTFAAGCSAPLAGDGVRRVNEDCLYLNVYRPAGVAADAKLPVMVFIPGGGNTSGSTDIYDGARMAKEGNAVVVIPGYRLGAFGFLALPELTGEDATNGSGTYGLLDQMAALEWVRDNVSTFGGNAADVTLSGESAGGSGVCNLLAAPSTKGLYSQAVIQSGVCNGSPSLADAETAGQAFASKLGCTDAACLRALPADAVLDAWPTDGPMTNAPFGSKLLPQAPLQAFASGAFVQVPTLVGFNRNEMFGFMHGMYPLDQAGFEAAVTGQFGDAAPELLTRYATNKYPHNEYAFGAIQGDSFFICPAFALAGTLAKTVPVSMYEFADMTAPNWQSLGFDSTPPEGYRPGPGHTAELFYLLDYKAVEGPLNAAQLGLADTMIKMWVDFGRKPDAAAWPAYSADAHNVVALQLAEAGGITTITSAFKAHNCDFWTK